MITISESFSNSKKRASISSCLVSNNTQILFPLPKKNCQSQVCKLLTLERNNSCNDFEHNNANADNIDATLSHRGTCDPLLESEYFTTGPKTIANAPKVDTQQQLLAIAKNALKEPTDIEIDKLKFNLPQKFFKSGMKAIVFSLNNTLIFEQNLPSEYSVPIKIKNGAHFETKYICIRPYLQHCLEMLTAYYEIIVFSDFTHEHTSAIIDVIDKQRTLIDHVITVEKCIECGGGAIKDLRVLNRDPKSIVMVECDLSAARFSLDNTIPIMPFTGDEQDKEMLDACQFLMDLKEYKDIQNTLIKELGLAHRLANLGIGKSN